MAVSSQLFELDRSGGGDFFEIVPTDNTQIDQVTTPEVAADQDNYPLPPGGFVGFSTDASRTFTGFSGARPGLTVIYNSGAFNMVIAHDSASSTAENRVLCHTGGDITLGPNQSTLLFYDTAASRWVTVKT